MPATNPGGRPVMSLAQRSARQLLREGTVKAMQVLIRMLDSHDDDIALKAAAVIVAKGLDGVALWNAPDESTDPRVVEAKVLLRSVAGDKLDAVIDVLREERRKRKPEIEDGEIVK